MKTINLLPKPRQQELYYESILRSLVSLLWLSLISFALVFAAQLGVKIYLQQKSQSLASQITQLQGQVSKNQNAEVKQQVKLLNSQIADYQNLAAAAPKWSQVLLAFAPLPPPGVQISSFTVDAADKSVSITGFAPTRQLVLQLYNNILLDSKDFYNINYPLDNLINATDVDFHYNFYVQDSLLK